MQIRLSHSKNFVLLALAALTSMACQGPVVGKSAQAGSSILIPIGNPFGAEQGLFGYGGNYGVGGAYKTDRQRGELVFRLNDPAQTQLLTRATADVYVAPNSALGRSGSNSTAGYMTVSLVDIPATAPTGTWGFNVTREWIEGGEPQSLNIPYSGEVTILPHQIWVDGEWVFGEPTPFAGAINAGDPLDDLFALGVGNQVKLAIPEPQMIVKLSEPVWATSIELTYDPDQINILHAYQPLAASTPSVSVNSVRGPAIWLEDDDGTLTVHAASTDGRAFDRIGVIFKVKANQEPLDPESLGTSVALATDEDGYEIAGVTVAGTKIR